MGNKTSNQSPILPQPDPPPSSDQSQKRPDQIQITTTPYQRISLPKSQPQIQPASQEQIPLTPIPAPPQRLLKLPKPPPTTPTTPTTSNWFRWLHWPRWVSTPLENLQLRHQQEEHKRQVQEKAKLQNQIDQLPLSNSQYNRFKNHAVFERYEKRGLTADLIPHAYKLKVADLVPSYFLGYRNIWCRFPFSFHFWSEHEFILLAIILNMALIGGATTLTAGCLLESKNGIQSSSFTLIVFGVTTLVFWMVATLIFDAYYEKWCMTEGYKDWKLLIIDNGLQLYMNKIKNKLAITNPFYHLDSIFTGNAWTLCNLKVLTFIHKLVLATVILMTLMFIFGVKGVGSIVGWWPVTYCYPTFTFANFQFSCLDPSARKQHGLDFKHEYNIFYLPPYLQKFFLVWISCTVAWIISSIVSLIVLNRHPITLMEKVARRHLWHFRPTSANMEIN